MPAPIFLGDDLWFPQPENVQPLPSHPGLIAVGGDLSADRLRLAYRSGLFPWTADPVTWWSPDPRGVIEWEQFHVSRSLAKVIRQGRFRVTFDQAFPQVMEGCAQAAPGREQSWVTHAFIDAYVALHRSGCAHSVECWSGDQLVGGVYGVAIGGFFAGESMFHRASDASKVALAALVERLQSRGFLLFDVQMVTPATEQLGAEWIPRNRYLTRLREAVDAERSFGED